MDFRANVERGAGLLDEEMPGWEERVDLSSLELIDPLRCILGQLYGDSGVIEKLIRPDYPHEYGFGIGFFAPDRYWRSLTEEWRVLIQSRRNVKELEDLASLETLASV